MAQLTNPTDNSVASFFDSLADEYTNKIDRIFPRYREMLSVVIDYLPRDRSYDSILELGCGTGNFSLLLQHAFPNATITFVDISRDSLEVCATRLAKNDRYAFRQQDFRELDFDPSSFDLVTSSIAVHHLTGPEKQSLFANMYSWLTPTGILTFNDQFAGATSDLYQRHMQGWKDMAFAAGSTQADWDMWMQHQTEHDHHDSLEDHLAWLKQAGFATVDCVWRCLLWTVLQARKS